MMQANTRSHGQLFHWLRLRLLLNSNNLLFRTAKARLITIVICTLLIAGVVTAGSWEGFHLLYRQALPGPGAIIGLLFDFFFLTLGFMLVFSGGLILFGSLFASPEAGFLLSLPAPAHRVFAYKFQSAIGFSSWAFVLLGLPVLAAFGIVYHVHWLYWIALPLLLFGFVLIPGSLGAIACMVVVNLAPRHRKQVLVFGIIAIIVLAISVGYRFVMSAIQADVTDRDAITGLIGQLSFARATWMPSHWITQGLQASMRGDWREAIYPLVLVWSNGLMLYLLAAATSAWLYRPGFNRIQTGGGLRRRYGGARLDRAIDRCLFFLDPQVRLLIVKDFRTFRRDPGQWAQVLIFAGLALTYFANSRQFYRSDLGQTFQHGVSLVNLLATCLLMCAYMGRFIYPMLSLEGRKFWVLGLMPMQRSQLLWGKFVFAVMGSLIIAVPLILTADLLLGLPFAAVIYHSLTIAAVAVGLSGLAIGIGALIPNFRETDPSKIAVGFGGTMNMLAGLFFLLVEIALIAGPYHLELMFGSMSSDMGQRWLRVGCALVGIGLAVAAAVLPLRAGTRALETMEF